MFNPTVKKNITDDQNKQEEPANPDKQNSTKEEEKIAQGISIHTMPDQYRRVSQKAEKAKFTGILIVMGGLLLIALVSVAVYYYIFVLSSQKKTILTKPVVSTTSPNTIKQDSINQSATTTLETVSLQPASSTEATTTSGVLPTTEITTEATTTASTTEPLPLASSEEISTSTAINYTPAEDSDNDGLSNAEELILGTDNDNQDSDGDGYSDLAEVNNLYNPAGLGQLSGNSGIKKYNKISNFTFLYPTEWEVQQNLRDNSTIFKSSDNQFIQGIVQPNTNRLPIEEWYKAQFVSTEIDPSQLITIKNNKEPINAIKSGDGMVVYFCDSGNNHVYIISYSTGASNILNYKNIFNIIVASFSFSSR